jgi:hypothetical protein
MAEEEYTKDQTVQQWRAISLLFQSSTCETDRPVYAPNGCQNPT